MGGRTCELSGRYPHKDLEVLLCSLFWLLTLCFSGFNDKKKERKSELHKNSLAFPNFFLGGFVGLRTWVEFTRVCPGGFRLACSRLRWPSIIWGMWMRDAWPAHRGRGRWTEPVTRGCPPTWSPHPLLSAVPDDLLVPELILSRCAQVLSWSLPLPYPQYEEEFDTDNHMV